MTERTPKTPKASKKSTPRSTQQATPTTTEDLWEHIDQDVADLFASVNPLTTPAQLRSDMGDLIVKRFDATDNPLDVANAFVNLWNRCVDIYNSQKSKNSGGVIPVILYMYGDVIARCLVEWHRVVRISIDGTDSESRRDMLAMYATDGPDEGIYVECGSIFRTLIRSLNPDVSVREIQEIVSAAYDFAPIVVPCKDTTLTAVGNGIFDDKTKTLMPFDPSVAFTTKVRTNYNPNAGGNVTFHDPEFGTWSLDSWLLEIAGGDMEIVRQLDAVTMACVRPRLKWEQMALLFNESGRNGKGTLLEMWRNLVGEGSCASVGLDEMNERFALSGLIGKTLNLLDEVPVGTALSKVGKQKSIITHDKVTVDRKNQTPIDYRFEIFIVACLNEMPYIMDKTHSMKRRLRFISLPVCFTGRANKRIKSEYVVSREVAECLLYRALHATYDEIPSSSTSDALMNDYERQNDPLLDFFDRVEKVLCGDSFVIQPYKCAITTSIDEAGRGSASYAALYNWYKGWRKKFSPKSSELSLSQFTKQMNRIARAHPDRNIKVSYETGGRPISLCGGQAATIAGDSQWSQFQMYMNGEWHRVDEAFEAFLKGEGSDSPVTFRWCAETASRRAMGMLFDVDGYARKHVPFEIFDAMNDAEKKRSTQPCHEHVEYYDFFECVVKETAPGTAKYALPAEEAWLASSGAKKVFDVTSSASAADALREDAV